MVATPFFALLFAVLETALLFFVSQVIETGTDNAARLIRTGQAQQKQLDEEGFRQAVCDNILGLFDCETDLRIDVQVYPSFASPLEDPLDPQGNLRDDFVYEPGAGGDIVVARAFLPWPTFVPGFGNDLSNMAGGNRLIAAASAFRNEAF
jgi:hypothetical protein